MPRTLGVHYKVTAHCGHSMMSTSGSGGVWGWGRVLVGAGESEADGAEG